MPSVLTISEEAHQVILLHYAKRGTQSDVLVGVLLGSKEKNEVIEVIPLFHCYVLQPSVNVAYRMVSEYAVKKKLDVLGLYTKSADHSKLLESLIKGCLLVEIDEKNPSLLDGKAVKVSGEHGGMKSLFVRGLYKQLVDFDDHSNDGVDGFLSNQELLVL
jgi:Uncharacterised protein family (UPF0172)